jgi:nucleoside-diphosphate-sugar epimerase
MIGGNGNISWHCSRLLAREGNEVYLLNRGATANTRRAAPRGTRGLRADARDEEALTRALHGLTFDAVCDFLCYREEHARAAVRLFAGRTRQYVFISSSSVYQRRASLLPFREDSPQNDPETSGPYIAGKVLCERVFRDAYEKEGFPVTIVRPGYTYDTIGPVSVGGNCFTAPQRILAGKPALVGGEGENLWTFTHSEDFAAAFVWLAGRASAIGQDYNITTDVWTTWREATETLLDALGVPERRLLHVPAPLLMASPLSPQKDLAYHKLWHSIFDNGKIRRAAKGWRAEVSLEEGLRRTLAWLYERAAHRRHDPALESALEDITREAGGGGGTTRASGGQRD